MFAKSVVFFSRIKDLDLDTPKGWEGDYRSRFIKLFDPIVEGTDYCFTINQTDRKSMGIDLWDSNYKKRRAFICHRKRDDVLNTAFNHEFYDQMRMKTYFPEPFKIRNNQPYFIWKITDFWNLICVAADKKEYIVDR